MVIEHKVTAGDEASEHVSSASGARSFGRWRNGPRTLLATGQTDQNGLVLRLSQEQTRFYDAGAETIFKRGLIQPVAPRTDAALEMLGHGRRRDPVMEEVQPAGNKQKLARRGCGMQGATCLVSTIFQETFFVSW
jgi:hypothetical protein